MKKKVEIDFGESKYLFMFMRAVNQIETAMNMPNTSIRPVDETHVVIEGNVDPIFLIQVGMRYGELLRNV